MVTMDKPITNLETIESALNDVATRKEPTHMVRHFDALDARGRQERLILPLVDNIGAINKLVIFRTRLQQYKKLYVEDLSSF